MEGELHNLPPTRAGLKSRLWENAATHFANGLYLTLKLFPEYRQERGGDARVL